MRAFAEVARREQGPRRGCLDAVKVQPPVTMPVTPPIDGLSEGRGGRALHDPGPRSFALPSSNSTAGVVGLETSSPGLGLGVAVQGWRRVVDGHDLRPGRVAENWSGSGGTPAAVRPARCAAPGSRRWCRGPRTCSRSNDVGGARGVDRRAGAGCRLPTVPRGGGAVGTLTATSWRSDAGRGRSTGAAAASEARPNSSAARPAGGDVEPARPRGLPHPRPRNAAIAKPETSPSRGGEAMRETTPLSSDSGRGLAGRIVVGPVTTMGLIGGGQRGLQAPGRAYPGRASYASGRRGTTALRAARGRDRPR